ncbi:flavin reductase family protein [Sphaerobacter sp.]|uniref:flavin reductase family protein n=1 Tax=Sphaerobacter sp. TaxID=2099654 RepID=UPI001DC65D5B|nr:flavin reductase family protein [Sphaerobacter sp.]MBX5444811.1 flavin reductase [Sphaerobacter sp.]
MVDQDLFRDVLARFVSGVVVVTTANPDGYHGMTVSSFCSVSLDPPLVLACINRETQGHDKLESASAFAVNILARDQSFLADQFSGRAPLADPTFARVPHRVGALGAPLIQGCVGWIECRPWARYPGGDHTIVVGQVEHVALGDADDPLVYFDRTFTELAWG